MSVTPPPPPPPPPAPEPTRLLRRSRTDRVVAGVCGGIGRYLGVDAVLIRIAFVVLTVAGGSGILLYIIGWIVMPEEKEGEDLGRSRPPSGDTARLVFGGALIAVGLILLVGLAVPRIGKFFWPLALIALGAAIIVQASSRR